MPREINGAWLGNGSVNVVGAHGSMTSSTLKTFQRRKEEQSDPTILLTVLTETLDCVVNSPQFVSDRGGSFQAWTMNTGMESSQSLMNYQQHWGPYYATVDKNFSTEPIRAIFLEIAG